MNGRRVVAVTNSIEAAQIILQDACADFPSGAAAHFHDGALIVVTVDADEYDQMFGGES